MPRLIVLLVLPVLLAAGMPVTSVSATVLPQHSVTVSGAGVATYPAFATDIKRYAVTTGDATGGRVTVQAATTDAAGKVYVNGAPLESAETTVSGLVEGDEVSVIIHDEGGTAAYAFIYLPSGFPELVRVPAEAAGGPTPGLVMLTLGLWTQPGPFFETAVDANGVPAYIRSTQSSMDLKLQPNGNYSVARGTGGPAGADIVELDSQFREVATHRTVGLQHTDGHDSILLPDGSAYLLAYEPNAETGHEDSIVQHVGADGSVLFEWNSKDHVDIPAETVVGDNPDYAHVNSVEVMDDRDLLVSFRHFSSVFKIARHPHDGFAEGEVIWKLGGRASDFTFVDALGEPSDGGPCAQHTATELPNGQIMVFDNGAWDVSPLCPNPTDIAGDPVARVPSRVAVWDLDETAGVATLVRDHRVGDRYAIFAGSAQALGNGNTLVGWASSRDAVVSELDAEGQVVWELQDLEEPKSFTYRAFKTDVPDAIAPEVSVESPPEGATYDVGERAKPTYSCTDRGGSNLQTCDAGPIDTSTVGTRTFTVSAVDGAGNERTVEHSYTVARIRQPDAMIRRTTGRRYVGQDEFGARPRQIVESSIRRRTGRATAVVQVRNVGTRPDRYRAIGRASSRAMAVRLVFPDGVRTSPRLAPGEKWRFRVRVIRRAGTRDGQRLTERITVRSRGDDSRRDIVWFRVNAR